MRKHIFTALATMLIGLASAASASAEPVCSVDSKIGKQLNLPVYEWVDTDVPYRGTIVAVHGLTFYAEAYDDLAKHLSSQGYRFYAMDMRGFGRWRDESAKFGGDSGIHFTQSQEDLVKLVQTLRQQDADQKIYAMGESLGANMALWLVSNHPESCDGAILGSLCCEKRVHPQARWVVDFAKGVKNPNKRLDLTPYITPYLSNDKSLTQACLQDQKIFRAMSPVELVKADKTNKLAFDSVDQLPAGFPILVISGKLDAVFKTSSLPDVLDKFGTKDVSVNILPGKGHLLLEHQSVQPEIGSLIDGWLTHQGATPEVVQLP
ncbi:MAG TPA: alpha/beta fold hydrolase [Planktothrix sp.]|jgi:alpha-beta hydrolase superfamily lysophospholipase